MPEPSDPAAGVADPGETRELSILYQLSAALSRSLQLDDLLADALRTIETLLGIPLSAVHLLTAGGDEPRLTLAAHRGLGERYLAETPAATLRGLGSVLLEARPVVIHERLDDTAGKLGAGAKREGIQSWALIPLVSRGSVVGVLEVASRAFQRFARPELEILEALGPDLGVAIENAQLFELVQRGRDEWLATVDAVDVHVALLDRGLRVSRANRALLDALGCAPMEIIGKPCTEVFPDLCRQDCPHVAARAGERVEHEVQSGGRRLRVAAYPAEGGVIHVARDITLERQREHELRHAEKLSAVSAVLAGVAHELTNPMTVVIAYADLLLKQEETAAFGEELHMILRNALRCQSIVRNLQTLSREQPSDPDEVDLNELVRETLPLFAYQMKLGGVLVEERLHPELPSIVGDRQRLQLLLVNVLNSASSAVARPRRGSWVRVSTTPLESRIELVVEDDGDGKPSERLPPAFASALAGRGGEEPAGLGLSLAESIAHEHGGEVDVSSESGRGTRVVIRLPVTRPRDSSRAEQPRPELGCLSGRRMLVIDDEPDIRSLVATTLELYGATAITAGDGAEALDRVRQDRDWDLLFVDLRMPVMGGDELVEQLRSEAPDLVERVLLTSGDVTAPTAQRAILHTGRPFLPKPFDINELLGAILCLLDERPAEA